MYIVDIDWCAQFRKKSSKIFRMTVDLFSWIYDWDFSLYIINKYPISSIWPMRITWIFVSFSFLWKKKHRWIQIHATSLFHQIFPWNKSFQVSQNELVSSSRPIFQINSFVRIHMRQYRKTKEKTIRKLSYFNVQHVPNI